MRIPHLFEDFLKLIMILKKASIESLNFFYSNSVSLLMYKDRNVVSILTVTKPQFYEYSVKVELVYQYPNTPVVILLDQLMYLINGRKSNSLLIVY